MTEFATLLDPASFSVPTVIFMLAVVGMVGFVGYRLRYLLGSVVTVLALVVFVLSIVLRVSLVWFWVVLVVACVSLVIDAGVEVSRDAV